MKIPLTVCLGICPRDLIKNELWRNDPSWLRNEQNQISPFHPNSNLDVLRRHTCTAVAGMTVSMIDQLCYRVSSLTRLIRVVAYLLRFSHNSRKGCETTVGCLTTSVLNQSLEFIVRHVQSIAFEQEIKCITHESEITPRSVLKFLNPFIDEPGLFTCRRSNQTCMSGIFSQISNVVTG